MQKVSPNVFVDVDKKFGGCNVGALTTSEGVVMVDSPQFLSAAREWLIWLQRRGLVRYLINTEYHRDHTTGNFFFDTTVVSHEATREAFSVALGPIEQLKETVRATDQGGVALVDGYQPRPPSITYSERMTLHVGDQTIKLMNLPGHTAHETGVYLPKEKVMFTGDNVVNRLHPQLFDGVPLQWLVSLKTIESLDVDVVVPGHGEVCDKAAVRSMISQLEEIMGTIRKAIASGMSREEVADRISFIDRHPVDEVRAVWLPTKLREGVLRVYDELLKQG